MSEQQPKKYVTDEDGWEHSENPVYLENPNYTQLPNEIIDRWMKNLSPVALMICLPIARYTIGFHRRHAVLSNRSFKRITSIKSFTTITKALDELIDKGYIRRRAIDRVDKENPNIYKGFQYGFIYANP